MKNKILSLNSAGVKLESEQKRVVCESINHFGSGQHPWADNLTVVCFSVSYTKYCLKKLIEAAKSVTPLLNEDQTIAENIVELLLQLK